MKIYHKIFKVFLVTQLIASHSLAVTWIRGVNTELSDFRGILRAEGEATSILDQQLKARPQAVAQKELLQTFENAQREFLTGSLERAQALFVQIANQKKDQDWNESSRLAIYFSLLRLGQLKSPGNEQDRYLSEAISFDPERLAEKDVFPPPMIQRLEELKSALQKQIVIWQQPIEKNFEVMIVDGRPIYLREQPKVEIWPGSHRVTFLSSTFQPYQAIGSQQELATIRPPNQVRFVEGSCQEPTLNFSPTDSLTVVFPNHCLRHFSKGKWLAMSLPEKKPIDLSVHSEEVDQGSSLPAAPTIETVAPKKWYHNKWMWIGAGAVLASAVGYAVYAGQNGGGRDTTVVQPTHQ